MRYTLRLGSWMESFQSFIIQFNSNRIKIKSPDIFWSRIKSTTTGSTYGDPTIQRTEHNFFISFGTPSTKRRCCGWVVGALNTGTEGPWFKNFLSQPSRSEVVKAEVVRKSRGTPPASGTPSPVQVGSLKVPFHSIGHPVRSRVTFEPINGAEPVFSETVTIFAHNFERKSIRYSILSLEVASVSSATLCCYSNEYRCEISVY